MKFKVCALLTILSLFTLTGMSEALTIRLAGQNPVDHQNSIQMNNFKKIIEKETGGKIKVKTYPASQLGDYVLVYEEVSKGTIDMALITIPPQFDPRQQITWTPYMVSDWSELEAHFSPDGWLYKKVSGFHEKMDIKFLGFFMDALGGLALSKEPKAPLDPTVKKEVLCRIPNMELCQIALGAMGYTTVSVPYADLYTALQTGVAEGWHGGAAVHSYLGFRDVIKYYYQMNIYTEVEQWVVNQRLWDSLSKKDRELIESTIAKINRESIKTAEKEEAKYQALLEKSGVKVTRYTKEQLKPMAEHLRKTVWPKLGPVLGEELTKEMIKEYIK